MASATVLALSPQEHRGVFSTPLDAATAAKATELLQLNHDRFHAYFNDSGFHNHIAHHMLALYAFNAPVDVLKRHYDANANYQMPMKPVDLAALKNLEDPAKFKQYLYSRAHYHDYLALFEREIQALGVAGTLQKYLFAGDERAKDMLNRLYAGILHPIIHLGYGLEWNQPAITAEGLAMTATHDAWPKAFYDPVEALIAQQGAKSSRTLASLVHEAFANKELKQSPTFNDDLRVRDGVVNRASKIVVPLAAQWTVSTDEVADKIAEVSNFTLGMLVGAQRPGHSPKIDFTLMHCANAVPLVAALAEHPAVPAEAKAQLVQRLGQYSLITFTAQGSPELQLEWFRTEWQPKDPAASWDAIVARALKVPDDGHVIKLLRALRFGEARNETVEGGADWLLKKGDYLRAGNMVLEVAEGQNSRFARGAGFDEAWQ